MVRVARAGRAESSVRYVALIEEVASQERELEAPSCNARTGAQELPGTEPVQVVGGDELTKARRRNHRTQPRHSKASQSNAPPPPCGCALCAGAGGLALMVTSSCACGPSTAPLVGLLKSTVNDLGDPALKLPLTIGMTAVWAPPAPSAQDKVTGVAEKSALVAVPGTGVSVTEIAPVEL